MEIALYGVEVSAFVAKVRIALDIKGLSYEERTPPGGYGSDDYRKIVPAGSVPGIVIDGAPLHDSNAIIEYLDEIAPEPPLLPPGPLDRARARALLGFHDTRLEAAARMLFPVVKADWRANPDLARPGLAAIGAALERLEDLIAPHPFAFGQSPTIADMSFPCTLQMARLLVEELGEPFALSPKLANWNAATSEVGAVSRSLAITAKAMEGWLAGFRR